MTTPQAASPPAPRPSLLRRLWQGLVTFLVIVFVCWNLFVLLARNVLDLWDEQVRQWASSQLWWKDYREKFDHLDTLTSYYAKFTGAEQGWSMFTPNLARSDPFLTARLEFTDGSSELVMSQVAPLLEKKNVDDDHYQISYVRIGLARQRKLEEYLMKLPNDLKTSSYLPMYEAFARYCLRRWQQRHPDDPRVVEHVVLLKYRIYYPRPGQDSWRYEEPSTRDFATFDAQGKIQ